MKLISLVVLLFAAAAVFAPVVCAKPAGLGQRTLVLLDTMEQKQTFSIFFDAIEQKGYDVTYARGDDASIKLVEFGEFQFDSLVVFAPKTARLGKGVSVPAILDFVKSGKSLLFAGSPDMADPMRELAAECGIEFDEAESYVLDHVNYDASDAHGDHSLIVADQYGSGAAGVVGNMDGAAPVLFRGVGHAILSADEDGLLLEVLTGSPYSYSHVPSAPVDEMPLTVGTTTMLVTALQARNNARLALTGSLEMFSNAFILAKVQRASGTVKPLSSGNLDFVLKLTAWVFQERNVLRMTNTHHFKADDEAKDQLTVYRVEDDLEFHTTIEEWNGQTWIPYAADDVQVEFQMLDPYVRLTMSHDNKGHFVGAFKAPDVYGVFQFKLTYRKPGYSTLLHADTVTVRPFRHNEFERFIPQAYPYYASAFSMMVCFLLFSVVFLHHQSK